MTQITKHDSKQEWEGDLSENGWVHFFVHGNTISVHNFLKWPCELIDFDVGRRFDCVIWEFLKIIGRVVGENLSDFGFFFIWTPEIAYVGTHSNLHKVKLKIKILFFGYKPFLDFQSTHWLVGISIDLVDLYQVLFQLFSWSFGQSSRFLNTSYYF